VCAALLVALRAEWDEAFKALAAVNGECSGRAVGVHSHAYTDVLTEVTAKKARLV
jgi:hypothetical protein